MKEYRINSLMAGILYLLGTVFGILSAVVGGTVMSSLVQGNPIEDVNLLEIVSSNQNNLIAGSLLILMMGISLVAMTIFLYPIFKKDSEELALGMLLFRGAMEGTWYFVTTITFLGFVAIASQSVLVGANVDVLETMANTLYMFANLMGPIGNIMFLIGATFLYVSFYRTSLIPKWLSLWGVIAIIPYMLYAVLHLFDLDSGIGFGLQMPLAIQEMVMALWLIIKGFNQDAIKLLDSGKNKVSKLREG